MYYLYGEISIAPIPWPKALDAPSKNKVHVFSISSSLAVAKMAQISSFGKPGYMG